MNRRNFLRNILVAGAGFTILPPASTYDRIWRAHRQPFWNALIHDPVPYDHNAVMRMTTWEWFRDTMNKLEPL